MLALGQSTPSPYGDIQAQTAATRGRELGNETALLKLADLKRSQASEQEVMAAIQRDPELAKLLFGGSVLGSLGSAGGPPAGPGGGPMTQQAVMPGQPPGAPQVVPGGQDLSRYAGVSPQGGGPLPAGVGMPTVTPPQSIIASLGPAGQPGMAQQPPQNPVLAMAQRDPRAAMMMQQQMQAQQDRQMQMQTQRLKMGSAMMGSLGQMAQGVTDQAGWDQLRQDAAQIDPQLAARLPQGYSKEVRDRVVAQALDVKDSLTLQIAAMNEQTDLRKQQFAERQAAGSIPEYVKGEGALNAWIDTLMQRAGHPRGTTPPPDILEQAQKNVQEGKIAVSASHGTGQLVQTPQGIVRVNPRTGNVDPVEAPGGGPMYPKPTAEEQRAASYGDRAKAAHDTAVMLEEKGLTPGIWSKVGEALPFGLGNYLVGEDQQRYRQTVNQFAQAILRKESGAAISPTEYTMTERTYFPQPGDSKKVIDQKRQERERVIQSMQEEGKQTGRTGAQAPPTSQGPTGTAKPVSQMSAEETRAEIAAIKARGGK